MKGKGGSIVIKLGLHALLWPPSHESKSMPPHAHTPLCEPPTPTSLEPVVSVSLPPPPYAFPNLPS